MPSPREEFSKANQCNRFQKVIARPNGLNPSHTNKCHRSRAGATAGKGRGMQAISQRLMSLFPSVIIAQWGPDGDVTGIGGPVHITAIRSACCINVNRTGRRPVAVVWATVFGLGTPLGL